MIDRFRHQAAKCIHFFYQVSFPNAANRRITGHLSQRVDIVCQKQGLLTHSRCGHCGLSACMTPANDDDVKRILIKHGGLPRVKRYENGLKPGPWILLNFSLSRKHWDPGLLKRRSFYLEICSIVISY